MSKRRATSAELEHVHKYGFLAHSHDGPTTTLDPGHWRYRESHSRPFVHTHTDGYHRSHPVLELDDQEEVR